MVEYAVYKNGVKQYSFNTKERWNDS